jgi:hypothetical protein
MSAPPRAQGSLASGSVTYRGIRSRGLSLFTGLLPVILFVLVLVGLGGRPLPPTGSLLTRLPLGELLLAVAALVVASMCLGLLARWRRPAISTSSARPQRTSPTRCGITRRALGAGGTGMGMLRCSL